MFQRVQKCHARHTTIYSIMFLRVSQGAQPMSTSAAYIGPAVQYVSLCVFTSESCRPNRSECRTINLVFRFLTVPRAPMCYIQFRSESFSHLHRAHMMCISLLPHTFFYSVQSEQFVRWRCDHLKVTAGMQSPQSDFHTAHLGFSCPTLSRLSN